MNAVLGIDTSCYTTSMALADADTGKIWACERALLPVRDGECGLQQSAGVFEHVRQIPAIAQRLFDKAPQAVPVAVCASTVPRSTQEDSYMPVFRVGESMARVLAAAYHVPFYATSHQDGHIRAALIDSGLDVHSDFLVLHLSGGTTEMLCYRQGDLSIVGGSSDLQAGQLVDRIGVKLGLPFPSGPALEQLALRGQAKGEVGVSMKGCFCQLSGAETRLSRWIDAGEHAPEDIAAEVYDLLCRSILRMVQAGLEETGLSVALLAGGVASSAHLRRLIQGRIEKRRLRMRVSFARPEYAGDNAVGVALIGRERYRRERTGKKEDK